jgi:TatD DNase family protein
MYFTDTHTHLYLEEFEEDRSAMIGRALASGVTQLFLPNIDLKSIQPMMKMVEEYPGVCFPMAGLHPTSVEEDYTDQLDHIRELMVDAPIIGIGECGLDLYWDKQHLEAQKRALITQLHWSLDLGLPVSLHIRDAFAEMFEVLSLFGNTKFRGVFHCFTGTEEDAGRAIGYGFHLGIGGIITFKNNPLQQVIQNIDPQHIVLESDAPFLAPAPYRGKRNEPAYIPLVAEKLASLWGISLQQVADITNENSNTLFKPSRT